ncbi:MAG TPA: nucleotidyltransferase family protein [Burkholderiales bacterium]|nr:nucleotidyltransferase family protein [Burkholderiales bacterium]
MPRPIVAILLAAGAGTRFGGDKLLHPFADGIAIAAHAARNLRAALPEVIAVVREDDAGLRDLLVREGCRLAPFAGAGRGMGASLAYGVSRAPEAAGWVIALADMPRIAPATICAVAAALEEGALIAAPQYGGERGHPVGFGAALREELLTLDGDQGARAVVERHRDRLKLIACGDPGVLYDVDRRSDLEV